MHGIASVDGGFAGLPAWEGRKVETSSQWARVVSHLISLADGTGTDGRELLT